MKKEWTTNKKAYQTFRKSLSSAIVPWTTKEMLKVVIYNESHRVKSLSNVILQHTQKIKNKAENNLKILKHRWKS